MRVMMRVMMSGKQVSVRFEVAESVTLGCERRARVKERENGNWHTRSMLCKDSPAAASVPLADVLLRLAPEL